MTLGVEIMRIVYCTLVLIATFGLSACRMIPRDKLPTAKRLKHLESEVEALGSTVDSLCLELFQKQGKHLVRQGYTLETIAKLYAVTPEEILKINPQLNGDKNNVKPGVVLNIKGVTAPNN